MNDPQVKDILAAVQVYLDGLWECDTAKLRQAFHPASSLFSVTDGKLTQVPLEDWCKLVAARTSPKSKGQGREHDRVVAIDMSGPDTAFVKLTCAILPRVFTDYLSFLKVDGRWQVIAKTYHTETLPG